MPHERRRRHRQDPQGQRQPTEEELRAAYEEQLRQVHVDDVLVQTVVSLLNLGALRAGLAAGGEAERDPAQLRSAIEGVRALLPLVEPALGPDAAPIREALSQLQLAYARQPAAQAQGGGEPGGGPARARARAAQARRAGPRAEQRAALGAGAVATVTPRGRSSAETGTLRRLLKGPRRPCGRLFPFA